MVSVFRDQHMRDSAFGRQRALDQPGRRRRLGHAFLAGPAGVFRAHRDDHPQLRRHDVQALGVRSSPIRTISPQPQGQSVLSGSITCSIRGRWSGKWPRLRAGRGRFGDCAPATDR